MPLEPASESPPVLKAIGLIEAIAELDHAPTLAELTTLSGLPKPTLHRWLAMLEGADLLRRLPDGRRYELASRATKLAFSILANNPGSMQRHQILKRVVEDLGESCNLTVLEGSEVMYLDRVEAQQPLRVAFQKGSRVPAHCSASGKLFLAMMPPARRKKLLGGLALERFTPNTITEGDALAAELEEIRRQRYAFDDQEYFSGLFCIAVPVYGADGRECLAALALQAPVVRLSRENARARLPVLQGAAQALAATLA